MKDNRKSLLTGKFKKTFFPLKNNYTLNFKYHIPDKNIHSIDADVKLLIQDNNQQISCVDVNTHIQENNLSYLTKTDFCDTLKIL